MKKLLFAALLTFSPSFIFPVYLNLKGKIGSFGIPSSCQSTDFYRHQIPPEKENGNEYSFKITNDKLDFYVVFLITDLKDQAFVRSGIEYKSTSQRFFGMGITMPWDTERGIVQSLNNYNFDLKVKVNKSH